MCRFDESKSTYETVVHKQSDQEKAKYKMRLITSIEVARYLSTQGLAFRGHDESESSANPGNFIQLVKTFGQITSNIKEVTLNNAPLNHKMICSDIQKEIVMEILKEIISDIGDSTFCLMVDEARDISMKEQMALVVRYVDNSGIVIERFLGVEHVTDTSALTLKATIDDFFSRYGLSVSKLRGQGYDGASNMRGQFNGLKTLILNENPCAYYIHCFAHQLQLALVAVAKKHDHISSLFDFTTRVLNVVGSSCKRRDLLRKKQHENIIDALNIGEISSGRGLNQETNLKRAGDTRWSSHYNTLLSLINMFDAVIDVLEVIGRDASSTSHRTEAQDIVDRLLSFDFVLSLFLMKKVLAITNELSQALQRKDQDIVNGMRLVQVSKIQIQSFRENGWDFLFESVTVFCKKHKVDVPQMDVKYVARGRRRRNEEEMTNLHHYKVETFYTILDMQLGELNARFSDSTMELLVCIACLDPSNSFSHFDKDKLLRLVDFYPQDFTELDKCELNDQLDTYIVDMRLSSEFHGLNGISDLARKMVETRRNKVYPLVYLILTLALTLPVATATVERAFSAMSIIKSRLRSRVNDEWVSDALLVFIERDICAGIDNETVMNNFQNMKGRKGQL
ncbi:PREDICTED: zinc finger MYM-type protein 1-like [Erythranthe guttata]|uniref:zinc finger MYM-type protein 1-like n=1 Tax=Erythranthe guttata TaxID=4155 RepID=UPI00064DA201|nr:PREDICTED: zinc finger MYM-type protein 1-like [Erythranthe guttata]|eukprot:XP_012832961.1 PREDICTED: zinc finger MYM-type protein 1-like [Erythranthe guttata]